MPQGTTQLTPGGRQAQQVFLSPANGDGSSYSVSRGKYNIDFVLPDVDAFVSADYGFRLRGQIKAKYKTTPAGGNDFEDVFVSPSCGLHGMIKSIVVTTASNQVLERVQNYPRLATHLINATSSSNVLCSQRQLDSCVLGVLADPSEVTGKQANDSLMYFNEINNLNDRRFSFQLETGMSKGKQDIGLRVHGGLTIQIQLNNNMEFLFAPNARDGSGNPDAMKAQQSISNVEFDFSDVTLEYTQVFMAGMAPDGTQVYQSFSDSMITVNNSFNSTSFAPGLPAVNTILFNFLSSARTQGQSDPQALNNFDLERGQLMINGERVSYFDRISAIQMKLAAYEALGPWEVVSQNTTIDQRIGLFGFPVDTYTSGLNMNGANRPQLEFFLSNILKGQQAYKQAPITQDSYKDVLDTAVHPAIMSVFFLGTRAVTPTPDGFVRSAVL